MPSLYLLYRLDGRTVVGEFLKLEIKVIQPGNKLHLRGVASDDDELLGEEPFDNKTAASSKDRGWGCEFLAEASFDDKTAAVMLRSGLTEQFVEADVLLFIKPERVFITRSWGLLVGLVYLFSVGIHI
mgnify:CR=1 FL=1